MVLHLSLLSLSHMSDVSFMGHFLAFPIPPCPGHLICAFVFDFPLTSERETPIGGLVIFEQGTVFSLTAPSFTSLFPCFRLCAFPGLFPSA